MAWYGVRCVFHLEDRGTYEERVTLWQVRSFDDAIARAEREARGYAATLDMTYLDFAQAYLIGDDDPQSGAEVFSLMRDSSLAPRAYLDTFFDNGAERQRSAS